jgi:hypothetical protein
MTPHDRAIKRLSQLIEEGDSLRQGDDRGHVSDSTQFQDARGWITASRNIVLHIFPDGKSPYAEHVDSAIRDGEKCGWEYVTGTVGEIRAVLKNLLTDIQAGLLNSLADRARAETFDNFLDHAREYLANGHKNEAGVIAGVVFEDTIRRIAAKRSIDESGRKLDSIISALAADGAISGVMAKRCRVAADVRTKATHAQWDEFDVGDVQATVAVTDELVVAKLDGEA